MASGSEGEANRGFKERKRMRKGVNEMCVFSYRSVFGYTEWNKRYE